jgi:hypothetical protein
VVAIGLDRSFLNFGVAHHPHCYTASVAYVPGIDTIDAGALKMNIHSQPPQHCCDCGSIMRQLDSVFWFFGAGCLQWKMSLPFCPT